MKLRLIHSRSAAAASKAGGTAAPLGRNALGPPLMATEGQDGSRAGADALPAAVFTVPSRGAGLSLTYAPPRFHTVTSFGDICLIFRPSGRVLCGTFFTFHLKT